jgi:hypothetical protein
VLEIEDQLRRYGEALEARLLAEHPHSFEAPRRRARQWPLAVAAAVAALAVVAGVRWGADRSQVVTSHSQRDGVFTSRTGIVLLFSDGIDGVTAVDLDHRVAARRSVPGDRPGDQPFRLALVDGTVVAGWGQIYASSLDGDMYRSIDDGTIFLPASEPGEVWTLTWASGRIGPGAAIVRRVNAEGAVVFTSSLDTDDALPLVGVPGGLVVRTGTGLAIWNASNGTVGPIIGSDQASSVITDGRHLAWCDTTCAGVHVVSLQRTGPPPAQSIAPGQHLSFSPDGRRLAILRPLDGHGTELAMRDVATGVESVVATGLPADGSVQWDATGTQAFYTASSFERKTTRIGRYDTRTDRWEEVRLPIGDAVAGAVPLRPDHVGRLLDGRRRSERECPAGHVYPSGRTGACTFRF